MRTRVFVYSLRVPGSGTLFPRCPDFGGQNLLDLSAEASGLSGKFRIIFDCRSNDRDSSVGL